MSCPGGALARHGSRRRRRAARVQQRGARSSRWQTLQPTFRRGSGEGGGALSSDVHATSVRFAAGRAPLLPPQQNVICILVCHGPLSPGAPDPSLHLASLSLLHIHNMTLPQCRRRGRTLDEDAAAMLSEMPQEQAMAIASGFRSFSEAIT